MGADIHAYVEFASPPNPKATDPTKIYWQNLTRNSGSRDYVLFSILAGVRGTEDQLFEPKGMPRDGMGYYTADDYWTNVAPEAYPDWANNEGYCSLAQAERWVESGNSVGERDEKGRLRRVSGPDWHSHSWLTADELQQALEHYAQNVSKYWPGRTRAPAEWRAMLAAMRSLEADGKLTRVLFWFDN